MTIEAAIGEIGQQSSFRWAWKHYPSTIRSLVAASGAREVIEIGGGRFPFFSESDVSELNLAYTANDISARELARAPAWASKALFDVQTADRSAVAPFADGFDFAFSKMVMEHVASYERAYTNIFTILRPGGLTVAFHPTLYAFPFFVNKLLPETASDRLLRAAFPTRTDDGIPKFPARYDGCVVSSRVARTLGRIGFRDVWQVPFYGHDYYRPIPVLREVQAAFSSLAARAKVTPLASYAYTIARK